MSKPQKNWAMINMINQRKLAKRTNEQGRNPTAGTSTGERPAKITNRRGVVDDPDYNYDPDVELLADDGIMELDEPQQDAPSMATGGRSASSSGGGQRGVVPLPIGVRDTGTSFTKTFTKQYHLRIFNNSLEWRTQFPPNIQNIMVKWPYHDLPVEYIGFYLTEDEMKWCQQFSKCTALNASVRLSNHTAVMPFETNSTLTTVGNNNVGVKLAVIDPKISSIRKGVFENPESLIRNVFWGKHALDLNVGNVWSTTRVQDLGAQYITRNYDARFIYVNCDQPVTGQPEIDQTYGENIFPVRDFVVKRINASMNEGEFHNWEHTFANNTVMFGRDDSFAPTGTLAYNEKTMGTRNLPTYTANPIIAPGNMSEGPTAVVPNQASISMGKWRDTKATKFGQLQFYNRNIRYADQMPAISFGIDSLYSATAASAVSTLVHTYIEVVVDVMLQVEIEDGNPRFRIGDGFKQSLRQPYWELPEMAYQHTDLSRDPWLLKPMAGYPNGNIRNTTVDLWDFDRHTGGPTLVNTALNNANAQLRSTTHKLQEATESIKNAKHVIDSCKNVMTEDQRKAVKALKGSASVLHTEDNAYKKCNEERTKYNLE